MSDATKISVDQWRQYVDSLDFKPLFVTVSGAHIYGFPSPDSGVDLRGCHQLPLRDVVGLDSPTQTIDRCTIVDGLEVDIVSHEVAKYLGLLVKNNGYILEQIFSPMIVMGGEFLNRLRPIASQCITRNHVHHYRGFFASQLKLIEKQEPVTTKAVLYAYRVLCTGIHLMQTGKIETDLRVLADELDLKFVDELIESKLKEKVAFKFDLTDHLNRLKDLEQRLELAFDDSQLPQKPNREAVNQLLIDLRLPNSS